MDDQAQNLPTGILEIVRWHYEPGDRLLLRYTGRAISREDAANVSAHVRVALGLPDDVPVVIFAEDWEFSVVDGLPADEERPGRL